MFLFVWLYVIDINVVCKLCISFDRKKNWANVRDTLFSGTYTYSIYNFCSKGINLKNVIVVVNSRTGNKFEYYHKKTPQDSNK